LLQVASNNPQQKITANKAINSDGKNSAVF